MSISGTIFSLFGNQRLAKHYRLGSICCLIFHLVKNKGYRSNSVQVFVGFGLGYQESDKINLQHKQCNMDNVY